MSLRNSIKADVEKAKAKRKDITDFVHTKPCSICGSTHGCNCERQSSDDSRGDSCSNYGYGYPAN